MLSLDFFFFLESVGGGGSLSGAAKACTGAATSAIESAASVKNLIANLLMPLSCCRWWAILHRDLRIRTPGPAKHSGKDGMPPVSAAILRDAAQAARLLGMTALG